MGVMNQIFCLHFLPCFIFYLYLQIDFTWLIKLLFVLPAWGLQMQISTFSNVCIYTSCILY